MSKFNFKKIAMGLAISTVFSSCFVSNVISMENSDDKTNFSKEYLEKCLNGPNEKIKSVIAFIQKLNSKEHLVPNLNVDELLTQAAMDIVQVSNFYNNKMELFNDESKDRILRIISKLKESLKLTIDLLNEFDIEYKNLKKYMNDHPDLIG